MPKRKSKSAEEPQKKKEQPIAKKRKVESKQTNGNESKPEDKGTASPAVRGRGRPKKTTKKKVIAASNAKASPVKVKTPKASNVGKKTTPKKKANPKTATNKKTGKKLKIEENGADANVVASPKAHTDAEKVSNKTPSKSVGKRGRPSKSKSVTTKTTKAKTEQQNGSVDTNIVIPKNEIKTEKPKSIKKRGRPSKTKNPAAARLSSAGKKVSPNKPAAGSTIKKRGRPKTSTSSATVKKAKAGAKGRGRPAVDKKETAKMSSEAQPQQNAEMSPEDDSWKNAASVYDFTVNNIQGEPVSLEKYKGNVLLIVNVASKCGLTSKNYAQLVELDEKYKERGLRILAFPCNQFSKQEPGTNEQICEFVKKKNVNFDMFDKINVNGKTAHPLWKYLKMKQAGTFGDSIKWNFSKFLVNREGQPVDRFAPTTEPLSIAEEIEALL